MDPERGRAGSYALQTRRCFYIGLDRRAARCMHVRTVTWITAVMKGTLHNMNITTIYFS